MHMIRSGEFAAEAGSRGHRLFSLGYAALEPLAALAEAIVVFCAGMAAIGIYNGLVSPEVGATSSISLGVVVIASVTYVTLSYLTGGYEPKTRMRRRFAVVSALRVWGATLGFLALCAFLFKAGADFSRVTVLIFAGLGAISVASLRAFWPLFVRQAVERNLIFVTNVLVLKIQNSADKQGAGADSLFQELRASGLRSIDWGEVSIDATDDEFVPIISMINEHLRVGRIEQIVIVADRDSMARLGVVVDRLRVFPLPVRVVLDAVTRDITRRRLTKTGSLVLAEWQRAPLSDSEQVLKRLLDISVAIVGLLMLSPLFVLTAIAIRLDSRGPVLFRQTRRGFGGKTFSILKFRSMSVADNGAVIVQAKKGDARITRVGKLIRRTSIDELPQIWNVLRGDMSIVGPRPHAVAHDDYYSRLIDEYAFRHHAKPGLTGWAQVKGLRGETPQIESMQARIENDIWYIDNWSIWLDISIILRTTTVIFSQKTAY